jgi:LPXTG-motif cell wall-anchored protein
MDRQSVRNTVRVACVAIGLAAASVAGAGHAGAAPACPDGAALTTIVDDQGVSQDACVAQAPAPVAGQGQSRVVATRAESALPVTGSGATTGLILASGLVACGVAASLVARRRHSS